MTKMQKVWLRVVTALVVIEAVLLVPGIKAQNPLVTPFYFTNAAIAYSTTACPTPASGNVAVCLTAAGVYFIPASGSPVLLGASISGVQKVNGVAPGATGNVTVGCSTPGFTAEAAAPAVSGGTISISVPAEALPVTCTGSGS